MSMICHRNNNKCRNTIHTHTVTHTNNPIASFFSQNSPAAAADAALAAQLVVGKLAECSQPAADEVDDADDKHHIRHSLVAGLVEAREGFLLGRCLRALQNAQQRVVVRLVSEALVRSSFAVIMKVGRRSENLKREGGEKATRVATYSTSKPRYRSISACV